ncbi:hypothetical protein K4F52_001542 [Lecanicillium sp. MT-2017a]|nr:hypothetical protein K4F52_001542 [Lecanicillium sp. MT-2017a]
MSSLVPRLRSAAPARLASQTSRLLSTTPAALQREPHIPDELGEGKIKGSTGGGKKLDSSADGASPKPKISNLSIPGTDPTASMSEEQKKEVDEHNKDFERKHDRGQRAAEDKVDKKFWKGQ